jgi:hypothetical protein
MDSSAKKISRKDRFQVLAVLSGARNYIGANLGAFFRIGTGVPPSIFFGLAVMTISSTLSRHDVVFLPEHFALVGLRDAKRVTRNPQPDAPTTPSKNYITPSGLERLAKLAQAK